MPSSVAVSGRPPTTTGCSMVDKGASDLNHYCTTTVVPSSLRPAVGQDGYLADPLVVESSPVDAVGPCVGGVGLDDAVRRDDVLHGNVVGVDGDTRSRHSAVGAVEDLSLVDRRQRRRRRVDQPQFTKDGVLQIAVPLALADTGTVCSHSYGARDDEVERSDSLGPDLAGVVGDVRDGRRGLDVVDFGRVEFVETAVVPQ